MSVRFITASLIQSSAFYARTSGSESGSFVSSSFYYGSTKELGEIKGDFIDNKVEVILLSQSFGGTDINVLTISASNKAPRVGIGVTNPIRAFDFKEVRDDDRGGEILIRSSRTTKGAEVGDEAGRLNFVIDSASYNDIETSGSVAQIVAKVTDENSDGVFGGLSLQVAESTKNGSVERIFIDPGTTHITGSVAVSSYVRTTAQNNALGSLRIGPYNSSIDSGDLSVQSEIEVFGNTENALRLVNGGITLASTSGKGNITASGAISASGTIVGSNLSGTNTGDQDLSSYIQNSQTSSMSVATASLANEVAYTNITGKPTLISSSGQVDHDATTNFDAAEHFTQANITTVGTVTSGDVSSILPTGTVSGSAQIDHDATTNFDAAEHFTQANITEVGTVTTGDVSAILPSGIVSSSAQVDHDLTANFNAAEHFTQANITTVGTVTSGDVSAILPTGILSGSAQIASDISGAFDLVSASLAADIPTNNNQLTNGAGYTANTGTVDTTGTPANNQLAIFTDSNTIEGDADLTYNGSTLELAGRASLDNIIVDDENSGGAFSTSGDFGFGSQIYLGASITTLTSGKVYYLTSTDAWSLASTGSEAAVSGLLGVRTSTGTNSTSGMLLNGIIRTGTSGTVGQKVYLADAGTLTTTKPTTSGHYVRIVGYIVGNSTIYFTPSNDYIKLS